MFSVSFTPWFHLFRGEGASCSTGNSDDVTYTRPVGPEVPQISPPSSKGHRHVLSHPRMLHVCVRVYMAKCKRTSFPGVESSLRVSPDTVPPGDISYTREVTEEYCPQGIHFTVVSRSTKTSKNYGSFWVSHHVSSPGGFTTLRYPKSRIQKWVDIPDLSTRPKSVVDGTFPGILDPSYG